MLKISSPYLHYIYHDGPKSTKMLLKLTIFEFFFAILVSRAAQINSCDTPVERDLFICIFIDFRCFITLS